MVQRLELVHFQITKNCNLRCWFCGQWGKKGFFADDKGVAVTFEKWLDIINELKAYGEKVGRLPDVMLWGGEPLVSPYFEEILKTLHYNGFKVGLVTNGVYIDKYSSLINECLSVMYVSIDGVKAVHDSIRGSGVYDKVLSNLKLINTDKIKLRIMSVITQNLIDYIDEFTFELSAVKPEKLILQEMIGLSEDEASEYKLWLKSEFNQNAEYIDGWISSVTDFKEQINAVLNKKYPIPVEFLPHNKNLSRGCLSPFKHVHIAWNGNVLFCTDFYDFSAGNINSAPLIEIFNGELANKYRTEICNNRCVTCKHCSWKNSESFYLD